jgi:hypothetical protein
LLEPGASTEFADRWGSTPVHSLSRLGAKGQPLVERLAARGVRISSEDYARLGDRLALEADPNVAKSDAVFLAAVESGHTALVEWLIGKGANVNARTEKQSRQTALHVAAWNGDLPTVRLLTAAGADPSALDREHESTPQQWAETAVNVKNDPKPGFVATYLASL